ncbi:hypothetical protein [Protofrankia symbiont of Coriaria ruscifolia]|uniref:hypothetical protein n=1 Tax=Protofrankia symbiont of Coriaria ruscifolia TaxID=1306542 RepID=UPI0010412FA3|nr:hypothetical protein [Protofrankia symbiont of Coriaria ruscifolia]
MSRPVDWGVLGLDADPTPGDLFAVRDLARRLLKFAADVECARGQVTAVTADGVVQSWLGRAGDSYRDELGEFPGQLHKLEVSHRMVGNALNAYGPVLETAQAQADAALARGRDARARRDHAWALVSLTQTALVSVSPTVTALAQGVPVDTAEVPLPDPAQVTQAIRNRDAAAARLDQASRSLQDAQDDLDAARRLTSAAKQLREDAAKICAAAIRSASHAGIRNRSWHFWEGLKERAGRFWNVAVRAAKITVAVLGVVALVIGGPAAWIVLAAALVVLADTLVRYGDGRASLGDVGLALLDCVPGTRGLTTIGGLVRGAGQVLRGGRAFTRSALAAGGTRLVSMAADIRGAPARTTTLFRNAPVRNPPAREGVAKLDTGMSTAGGEATGRAGEGAWAGEGGLTLTAEQNVSVDRFLDHAAGAEPSIRAALSLLVARQPGAELVGLDQALKSADSLKRKVATTLFHAPNVSTGEALVRIRDSVRYTACFSADTYSGAVRDIVTRLQSHGFERLDFKNGWGGDGYKGINSIWRDPGSGQVFELQLHTADSFDAKTITHVLYEQVRLPGTSAARRSALDAEQNEVFSRVPVPTDAVDLT